MRLKNHSEKAEETPFAGLAITYVMASLRI